MLAFDLPHSSLFRLRRHPKHIDIPNNLTASSPISILSLVPYPVSLLVAAPAAPAAPVAPLSIFTHTAVFNHPTMLVSAANDSNSASQLNNVPSLISARSANSLISENRPTRIQAETLLVLNGLLDELLLTILTAAKSLATDRIKSDGMLRVFSNNLLAKDAVLEAELELRSYLEARRAEGAKVPLGLMATSRLDGTDNFPVESAYKALRIRCQYYSTLGDSNDESAARDQNIMSPDGRPIATVTPAAAIYVTALLEYVGVHLLQNVARVIERDNSDEASLFDLRAAIIEDEQLNPLFNKMAIRQELVRRIDLVESRQRKGTEDGAGRRIVKPWHVPDEHDFDEAAGPTLFSSKRASMQQFQHNSNGPTSTSSSSRYAHAPSNSLGSTSTLRTSSSIAHNSSELLSGVGSTAKQNAIRASASLTNASDASNTASLAHRQSSDRSWSGVFGGIKRRNSFKQASDTATARLMLPTDPNAAANAESALDADNDFEALMLSGQTMKVSLTPNRLHTIEVSNKGADTGADVNVASLRRRPGTPGPRDEVSFGTGAFARGATSMSTQTSQTSTPADALSVGAVGTLERVSTGSAPSSEASVPRPSSRASLQTAMRPERRAAAPPPSSYRSPSPMMGKNNVTTREIAEEDGVISSASPLISPPTASFRRSTPRLQPRDDEAERSSSAQKDLMDLFRSTPPSSTSERFGHFGSDTSSLTDGAPKRSAMGERVRTLFGRKTASSNGHGSPSSPRHKALRSEYQRSDPKASLEGSQDTFITSSTTNSIEQTRSLISPNEVPFNRNTASRSSTSTSEHAAVVGADTITEAKPTPDVAVVEPERAPVRASIGLGVGLVTLAGAAGAGAAVGVGAVAASRNASNGSRSTSYGSQTHGMAEAAAQEESPADDASTTSKSSKAAEELVSRKVPWGYKRNSTSVNAVIERNGTPTSDRRRSVGYTSSTGHGVLALLGQAGAPSSDVGHHPVGHHSVGGVAAVSPTTATGTTTAVIATADEGCSSRTTWPARGSAAPTAWTGGVAASGSQSLSRRGSFANRPSSANASRRPSTSLETIQVLAELEKAMRNCHNVDECRALVQKAMRSDGLPLSPSGSRGTGVAEESAARDEVKAEAWSGDAVETVEAAAARETIRGKASTIATSKAPAATNGHAPADDPRTKVEAVHGTMSVEQSSSLETVEQGLVVAWLLGGDDSPTSTHAVRHEKEEHAMKAEQREHVGKVVSALVDDDVSDEKVDRAAAIQRGCSIDLNVSRDNVEHRASSSVVSLQSNYKDAQDELSVE